LSSSNFVALCKKKMSGGADVEMKKPPPKSSGKSAGGNLPKSGTSKTPPKAKLKRAAADLDADAVDTPDPEVVPKPRHKRAMTRKQANVFIIQGLPAPPQAVFPEIASGVVVGSSPDEIMEQLAQEYFSQEDLDDAAKKKDIAREIASWIQRGIKVDMSLPFFYRLSSGPPDVSLAGQPSASAVASRGATGDDDVIDARIAANRTPNRLFIARNFADFHYVSGAGIVVAPSLQVAQSLVHGFVTEAITPNGGDGRPEHVKKQFGLTGEIVELSLNGTHFELLVDGTIPWS
jgi:hypothetical protein